MVTKKTYEKTALAIANLKTNIFDLNYQRIKKNLDKEVKRTFEG